MNYFVLFSVILIAASVVVLLIPPTPEGFTSATPNPNLKPNANAKPAKPAKPSASRPAAAGQHNLSSAAGAADGGSSNQYLMDDLLAQQDRFMEAFENRNKTNGANAISATTTKKKGIASTGATIGGNVPIPKAGCNKDKCTLIDPKATDKQGNPIAFQGNCINPKYDGSDYVNYGIKYCPAYQPTDGAYDEECQTCGYYEYKGICRKKDPNKDADPPGFIPTPENPSNCDYESYDSPDGVTAGQIPGTNGGDDGGKGDGGKGNSDKSGNSCSTCKLNVNKITQCVLPGCFSADDGYLPFPDDGGYNFAEGCFYYNPDPSNPGKILPGMEGRSPGYYCPSITTGGSFDSGGGDGDPCYTKPDPIPDTANPNAPSYSLDYAKFVKMDKICSNDKQESKQKFVPGKDAPVDDNDMPPPKNTKHRSTNSTVNHQHSGAINVYHHSSNQKHGKGQGNSSNSNNSNNTYIEPVGGATVLGYL
jgi:hypothetical protein